MLRPKFSSLLFLLLITTSSILHGGSSDLGGTGLLRIPTGRTIPDGDIRFTFSNSYPYRHYCVTFGFLPFLELNGRLVEIRDEEFSGPYWGGYGYYKDKVADFKVHLLNEKEFFPSMAIGAMDFHGTQLFFSEYIAASKKIGDFDFTLGYGGNLFGPVFNREEREPRELDGLFGGVEWNIRDNLSLLFEYDPTKELTLGKGGISSQYNYGLRWSPRDWFTCGYSYQRGAQHGFYFALTYPFGAALVPQKPDEPFYGPLDWTPLPESLLSKTLPDKLAEIKKYLSEEGFVDVQVNLSPDMKTLYMEIENRRYLFHGKAIGRALRIAVAQTPSDIEKICVVLKQIKIPMVEVTVSRADYIDCLNRHITEEELMSRVKISNKISQKSIWWNDEYDVVEQEYPAFAFSIEPVKLENFWNDPSGFFKLRVGPAVAAAKNINKGLSVSTYLKFPLYSNISTNNPPLSAKPVRSDIDKYLDNTGIVVDRLFANQFFKIGASNYLRFSAGYLELQYAGVSAEYLRTFKQGRFALGREVTWAVKRDDDSILGLRDNSAVTLFWNAYIYSPELETTFSVKIGEFLAGDRGVRMEVSRDIRGGKVFLWYTKTDTAGLTGANKGYSDKGVGFALPVRVLWHSDARGHYTSAVSPWSRDSGQPVNQLSLYNFLREFTPAYLFNYPGQLAE